MQNYSQIGQDLFVLEQLKFKKNGTFVDIGACHPRFMSNTYLLESQYNWTGICIDIEKLSDHNSPDQTWEVVRPITNLIIQDALTIDYNELFAKYCSSNIIDYLSIDLEPPETTLECLYKIPFDHYKFRVITFETDEYRDGNGLKRRDDSRNYLKKLGYKFIKNVNLQDDFYIFENI